MATTSRLHMPLLAAGQAQKEVTHNEALLLLDGLTQAVCTAGPNDTPPATPVEGAVYICGGTPTGAWSGQAGNLAINTPGGWRFVRSFEGLRLADGSTGMSCARRNGQWVSGRVEALEVRIGGVQVLGTQRAAIAAPVGGGTVDTEARAVIGQLLTALRGHGLIAS